ncbi:hypothetical protein LZ30DRAFT_611193, partial [Colletotrichum cereale]
YANKIIPSVLSFLKSISNLTSRLLACDYSLFPLCYSNFSYNNTIVNNKYCVLSLIN